MSRLYELCVRVGAELHRRHGNDSIALIRAKGELANRAGFLVTMVGPGDPDDAVKLDDLRSAARELGLDVA